MNTNWKIACGTYNGTTVKVYKNGLLGNSGDYALSTVTSGGFRIAQLYTSSYVYANVQIAEIIYFNRSLDDTERNAVHEYLSNKYGITLS